MLKLEWMRIGMAYECVSDEEMMAHSILRIHGPLYTYHTQPQTGKETILMVKGVGIDRTE